MADAVPTHDGRAGTAAGRVHVLILRQNEPYPYGWVGQEAQALARAAYDVTVITPSGFGYDTPSERRDGVTVRRFPAPPVGRGLRAYVREYAVTTIRMARLVRSVQRQSAVDVVIVCTPPDFLMILALPLRRRGAGIVYDQRDPGPELFEAKFGRRGLLYRLLVAAERFAVHRADIVMPHNELCAELVRRRGGVGPERTFVVGVGPDERRIFPVAPRPTLKRGRPYLVLWIGTMSDQENLELLIEAAAHLVHERGRTDVAFSIVGPGDARDAVLEEIQRRRLDDHVTLHGVVTNDDDLRAYIATADVCVSVDRRNPMNDASTMMKVLEYMAMGRPVVQFPLTEMSSVCGDATVYAEDGNPIDLAEKIGDLLDDPGRREQLGVAARRRMLDGRMWSDQIPVLVRAVEEAMAASRARHPLAVRGNTSPVAEIPRFPPHDRGGDPNPTAARE